MGGNGDMAPFMAEVEKEFGAATSLEDFERKAQMLNYVQHRAIFEGMNAHLWAPNTGRMLWMTQPAWPSSTWQILSSDYDTQASFYAVKKSSETLHVQLDPNTFEVQIANSLPATATALDVHARVYSLENKMLMERREKKDAATGVTLAFALGLAPHVKDNVAFVKLELHDASGKLMSDNFYWIGGESSDYRKLNRLAPAQVALTANAKRGGGLVSIHVKLANTGNTAAIETKLTLLQSDGLTRVLPAYYGDNYISLLPGETKDVEIEVPVAAAKSGVRLGVGGWNIPGQLLEVGEEK
jgi:hypothetical protein